MKKITMYTGPFCNYCEAAKRLLARNNATYNRCKYNSNIYTHGKNTTVQKTESYVRASKNDSTIIHLTHNKNKNKQMNNSIECVDK